MPTPSLSPSFSLSKLATPAVATLISFLAYSSQYLLNHFEPAPLRRAECWRLNLLAGCIWICYYRTCTVDPGWVPRDWKPAAAAAAPEDRKQQQQPRKSQPNGAVGNGGGRWCRKCEAYKPPRAHHCRTCQRCIPKMDHHCPWTANCVSHFTLPHFLRFLFYAVVGMGYLEAVLVERAGLVWRERARPSYLGPTALQLAHLFVLLVVNSLTVFMLFILLVRTVWALALNTTTIEEWEIERHQTLLRRARHFGGYLQGPGGVRVRIKRQEFPYDVGVWGNLRQGMGSGNILSWFWPFARTLDRRSGLEFEVNGFEDPNTTWPPPDPDRIPWTAPAAAGAAPENNLLAASSSGTGTPQKILRRKRFHQRFDRTHSVRKQETPSDSDASNSDNSGSSEPEDAVSDDGEEGWRNADGDRLRDFGVEEEVEFYDEEDIPLAVLMAQRGYS
ncbi:putative palmitoyltransferase with autoacylation activity Pfa4 [Aspergillus brunneoviolaceus CBS 621.78]|uniref:Zf-DHHC-domain-containing protein n=1 Tax=Aspergillus brunneoviolaceus CBS 621.78 TaxID=1450534 RepID=A0ACD1G2Y7_9EURO|nr:zf-DHHC-domain-containing protein [Aspergillus brunneoviolaceus CBS 621.78]RAH43592.1 zf-DHHC-domain-containing protein [Aspergillus brunneoviolaceus CBS 621.78]